MRSLFASLRTLTLPAGATSGGRIVLDGISGQINVYNTDGDLIGTFDPDGLVFRSREFNPARIFVYDPVQNVQTIYADDGTETAVIQLDGRPDTLGVWVIDAASGGYVRMTPDADGVPGIEFSNAAGSGTSFLVAPGTSGSYVNSPDSAQLTVPFDIDIRCDVQTDDWTPSPHARMLATKFNGVIGEWTFQLLTTGRLKFSWRDTTADDWSETSSANPVPAGDGRLAVRVTAEDATNQIKFYTAATMAGPWTQLGTTQTGPGGFDIIDGSGSVRIGGNNTPGSIDAWDGRYYGFELYSGVAGTLKADVDFTTLAAGTTSFTDAQGNVWTLTGSTSITQVSAAPGRLQAGTDNTVELNGNPITSKVGFATRTTDVTYSTTTGTWVDAQEVTGLTLRANHRYKITCDGWWDFVTGGSAWAVGDAFEHEIQVDEGSGYGALSIPCVKHTRTNLAAVGRWLPWQAIGYHVANANTTTAKFKMRVRKQAGAATVTAILTTNVGANPGTILVEDIGT
jgi:hypothetical protein